MTSTGAAADQTAKAITITEYRPATRSAGGDARAVLAALKSDWIKASTVRVNRAILLLALVGGLLVSWAVAMFVTDRGAGRRPGRLLLDQRHLDASRHRRSSAVRLGGSARDAGAAPWPRDRRARSSRCPRR